MSENNNSKDGSTFSSDYPQVIVNNAELDRVRKEKGVKFYQSPIINEYNRAKNVFLSQIKEITSEKEQSIFDAKERVETLFVVKKNKQEQFNILETKRLNNEKLIKETTEQLNKLKNEINSLESQFQSSRSSFAPIQPAGASTGGPPLPPPPPISGPPAPPPPPMAKAKGPGAPLKKAEAVRKVGPSDNKADMAAELKRMAEKGKAGLKSVQQIDHSLERTELAKPPVNVSRDAQIESLINEQNNVLQKLVAKEYSKLKELDRELKRLKENFNESKEFLLSADDQINSITHLIAEQDKIIEKQRIEHEHLKVVFALNTELNLAQQPIPLPENTSNETTVSNVVTASIVRSPPAPPPPPMAKKGPPPPPAPPSSPLQGRKDGVVSPTIRSPASQTNASKEPEFNANRALTDSPQFKAREKQRKLQEAEELQEELERKRKKDAKDAAILAERKAKADKMLSMARKNYQLTPVVKKQIEERETRSKSLQNITFEPVEVKKSKIEQLKKKIQEAKLKQEREYQERLKLRQEGISPLEISITPTLTSLTGSSPISETPNIEISEVKETVKEQNQENIKDELPNPFLKDTPPMKSEEVLFARFVKKHLSPMEGFRKQYQRKVGANYKKGTLLEDQIDLLEVITARIAKDQILNQNTKKMVRYTDEEKMSLFAAAVENIVEQLGTDETSNKMRVYLTQVYQDIPKEFKSHDLKKILMRTFYDNHLKGQLSNERSANLFAKKLKEFESEKLLIIPKDAPVLDSKMLVKRFAKFMPEKLWTLLDSEKLPATKEGKLALQNIRTQIWNLHYLIEALCDEKSVLGSNKKPYSDYEKLTILEGAFKHMSAQLVSDEYTPFNFKFRTNILNHFKTLEKAIPQQYKVGISKVVLKDFIENNAEIVLSEKTPNWKVTSQVLLKAVSEPPYEPKPLLTNFSSKMVEPIKIKFNSVINDYVISKDATSLAQRYKDIGGANNGKGTIRESQILFLESILKKLQLPTIKYITKDVKHKEDFVGYSDAEKFVILAGVLENFNLQLERDKNSKFHIIVNELYDKIPKQYKNPLTSLAVKDFYSNHLKGEGLNLKAEKAFVQSLDKMGTKPKKKM